MPIRKTAVASLVVTVALLFSQFALANARIEGQVNYAELKQVRALLAVPESKIDLAGSKLAIDHLIDPSINVDREMARLNQMVADIESLGPKNSMQKKDALRHYLYEPNHWNQYQPYAYDFSDPKGTKIQSKLLANYLDTKKGNCISMPFLFIALGQKLGLDTTASTAPQHVFVKFKDDATGITYNLETTSGANPARDEWLRKGFPMTKQALKNGVYLQKLSKKKTVALMAVTLLQHYLEQEQFAQVIATANLILDFYPKSINSVVYMAWAYNELIKAHGLWKYHTPSEVPPQQREDFIYLVSRVNWYHQQAEKLGWFQPTQEENEAYLQTVSAQAKDS